MPALRPTDGPPIGYPTMTDTPTGLQAYRGPLAHRVDRPRRRWLRWFWLLLIIAVIAALLAWGISQVVRSRNTANRVHSPPIEFGIYPGGPVGTTGITDSPKAEIPATRLAALQALRASTPAGAPRPFVVRLYEAFTGQPSVDSWTGTGTNATTDAQITSYSENGFDIDLVVRYEPVNGLGPSTVPDYLNFVRSLVQRYGPNSNVKYLQITNEVNETSSPGSSDGYYPNAEQALVYGVEAAYQESTLDGHPQVQVGFNWAYDTGGGTDPSLWAFIHSQGLVFQKSVTWVGLDDYPGTFTDLTTTPMRTGPVLVQGVQALRSLMDQAGLSPQVSIHISETGWPTGPKRTRAQQVVALSSMVNSVSAVRAQYLITDFEWFDLRDSNSSIPNKQEQYGLMTDNYHRKPAYSTYKQAVTDLGP